MEQVVRNLHPNTAYQLSGWLKVTDAQQPVILGVHGHGGPDATARCVNQNWERHGADFETGPEVTEVTVFIDHPTEGEAFADNLGLPRTPQGK